MIWHLLWSPVRETENWAQTIIRVSGNLLRWLILLPVIAVGVIWVFADISDKIENRPRKLTELDGVVLGSSRTEVTLAKGYPDEESGPVPGDDINTFGMIYGDTLVVLEGASKETATVWRICDTKPSYYSRIIGISSGDSEKDVLSHLGEPSKVTIDNEGITKILQFNQYDFSVYLEKAAVVSYCVGGGKGTLLLTSG